MVIISYVNSCYNAEQFLDGLIENLLQQDHDKFEIIVVDSASTDDSARIAEYWQNKDDRVRLVRQDQRTPYGVSWLVGWQNAKGQIISNSNSDDRSYQWRGTQVAKTFLARQVTRDVKPYAFYYGGYETRIDGTPVAKGIPPSFSVDDMTQFFRCGVHVHWDAALSRVVDWELMFKAAYEYKSAFDYWLVLYFMSLGAEGVPIPSCFSIYNQREDSLEQADKERNTFESLRAIETFYPNSVAIRNLYTKTKVESPGFFARYQEFKAGFDK